jgi:hypothetical protein
MLKPPSQSRTIKRTSHLMVLTKTSGKRNFWRLLTTQVHLSYLFQLCSTDFQSKIAEECDSNSKAGGKEINAISEGLRQQPPLRKASKRSVDVANLDEEENLPSPDSPGT